MKTGKEATTGFALFTLAVGTILLAGNAVGQQPTTSTVQQTAFTRAAAEPSGQRVRFSRQAPKVGDEIDQTIAFDLRLTMSMRQGNQIVGKNQASVHTNQHRIVTTTEVNGGLMTAVQVRYAAATKQVSTADENPSSNDAAPPLPVQGKTYLCRREPGENGQLVVTDLSGNRPPSDEFEVVNQQMQMVGRPNPLVQYLAGRSIAVGEKVELPNDSASQIFNLSDKFGKVTHFTLTLQKVESDKGITCAMFLAAVEAAASDATQMRLDVQGPLVVEVDTCRARRVSLVGPIAMSDSRGSYSTAYQMIGTGRLNMSIASAYRVVRH